MAPLLTVSCCSRRPGLLAALEGLQRSQEGSVTQADLRGASSRHLAPFYPARHPGFGPPPLPTRCLEARRTSRPLPSMRRSPLPLAWRSHFLLTLPQQLPSSSTATLHSFVRARIWLAQTALHSVATARQLRLAASAFLPTLPPSLASQPTSRMRGPYADVVRVLVLALLLASVASASLHSRRLHSAAHFRRLRAAGSSALPAGDQEPPQPEISTTEVELDGRRFIQTVTVTKT